MRVVDDYSRYMFHFAGHMNDRLAFRDFKTIPKLAKHLLEQSSLKFGVIIGDDKARLSGISAVFKLIRLDNPSSLLKKLKIASDSGTTIIIELLTHLDAPEDKLKLCATQLRLFIAHHLEKDFRHNPQFSGLYVTPAVNENDEAPVLRVIIVYKRIVSIDMWLQHMLIPYSFSDIMPALTGEIRTNIDLSEMVKNVTANVDSEIVAMVSQLIEMIYIFTE